MLLVEDHRFVIGRAVQQHAVAHQQSLRLVRVADVEVIAVDSGNGGRPDAQIRGALAFGDDVIRRERGVDVQRRLAGIDMQQLHDVGDRLAVLVGRRHRVLAEGDPRRRRLDVHPAQVGLRGQQREHRGQRPAVAGSGAQRLRPIAYVVQLADRCQRDAVVELSVESAAAEAVRDDRERTGEAVQLVTGQAQVDAVQLQRPAQAVAVTERDVARQAVVHDHVVVSEQCRKGRER